VSWKTGVLTVSERGTGQGSVISPLLANVYLHYVFDLWAERWRHREAVGTVIIVRYADDLIIGFEHEKDARRFWDAMRDRLQEFSLSSIRISKRGRRGHRAAALHLRRSRRRRGRERIVERALRARRLQDADPIHKANISYQGLTSSDVRYATALPPECKKTEAPV
jgi:Reverse transcriptase (RNA-dependent DNA polymerase)